MDATRKPLRIPPAMAVYAEEHGVFDIIQKMVEKVLVDRPEDPIQYMIDHLSNDNDDVPRVFILGPPASGKHTMAKLLCKRLNATHLTPENVLSSDVSLLVKEAQSYRDKGQEVPDELWAKLMRERLSQVDCIKRGWVLEGFPKTRDQALMLQMAGVCPGHLVVLDAPDIVLIERNMGKRIDITDGVLTFVLSKQRSLAPHTPRILLYGPPGSGRSLQASLLAQKYGIINICCGQVLKEAVADQTKLGELIQPYIENDQQVPDNFVLKILTDHLSSLESAKHGWVLHGFPQDTDQAALLKDAGFMPNRVFSLDLSDDVVIERLSLCMTDPVSGERYHSIYKPAPRSEVQERLQQNPKYSEEKVQARLDAYHANADELEEFYQDVIHINADQDPYTVFEFIESYIVSPLPKSLPEEPTSP
ncbi:adenylate kinase 8 isoform X2 [Xenopus laevis]|uniref:Adenylate kinase 8 isoform X2 n=1 Tax=Xenopus laevis TaxID=8355 RepID=A0A8J1LH95_XENLA|nr:adenylate kinase 8 isoform X2 [Xenopus laevis]